MVEGGVLPRGQHWPGRRRYRVHGSRPFIDSRATETRLTLLWIVLTCRDLWTVMGSQALELARTQAAKARLEELG